MEKNRTAKYFKYAIGEIILVVIGILIAIQINNWNQTNSENNIAEDYIKNIKTELNSDLNFYSEHNVRNHSQIKQIGEILNALNSEYEISFKKEILLKLMDVMEPFPFSAKVATYTDLVTSGKMGLIKPDTLRQRIIAHYNLVEQIMVHINRETDYNWNHLHPFFNENGYFDWRMNPRLSVDTTKIKQRKHFPIFELEKSSVEFKALENNLYFRQAILTTRNLNLDELIKSTQNLINEINLN